MYKYFKKRTEQSTRNILSQQLRFLGLFLVACICSLIVFQLIGEPALANYEEPKYEVVSSEEEFEIRKYSKKIAAEVELKGDQRKAMNQGFRILASYIFGQNVSKDKISMTSPVVAQASTEISMTTPVTAEGGDDKWRITFYMPSKFSLKTLPVPVDKRISISEVPGETYAVTKFSGRWTKENFESHKASLKQLLKTKNIEVTGQPINAYYDPPFTLPLFRRNEVMIPVAISAEPSEKSSKLEDIQIISN